MARKFNSNNYAFRPTTLAHALQKAGMTEGLHTVREPKQSITTVNDDGDAWLKERMIPVRRLGGVPCRAVA